MGENIEATAALAAGLDANRRLAQLLGWTNIFSLGTALLGTPPAGQRECRGEARVPDWTGDWCATGPLMVEYLRRIALRPNRATAAAVGLMVLMRDRIAAGAGDDAARRLIVDSMIELLETCG